MQRLSFGTFCALSFLSACIAGLVMLAITSALIVDARLDARRPLVLVVRCEVPAAKQESSVPSEKIEKTPAKRGSIQSGVVLRKPGGGWTSRPDYHIIKSEAYLAAAGEGVEGRIVFAIAKVESSLQLGARGKAGEIGVMQLKPETARELRVNPWDWKQNMRGGARLFRRHFERFGNVHDALSAYNRGPGDINNPLGRAYAAKVLAEAENE